jgi:ATP-dependent Lon protease
MTIAIYPLLPLRDIVVFPHMVATLFVGREKSIIAIEYALKHEGKLLMVAQKDAETEDPGLDDLYKVGTIGSISQMISLPDGTVKILIQGVARAKLHQIVEFEGFIQAQASEVKLQESSEAIEVLNRSLISSFKEYALLSKKIAPEFVTMISETKDIHKVVDSMIIQLPLAISKKQELLETFSLSERVEKVLESLSFELNALKIEEKVKARVKTQMEKNQREYFLTEQMKAIQSELQQGEGGSDELTQLQKRIEATKFSKEARQKADAELKKLRSMNPMSSEASIIRNYLEWLLDLPWSKPSKLKNDLKGAQKTLDHDHYGLKKVKERILEHLAVQQRVGKTTGQVLCFVGPPGVGKTSLGKSIAAATGREFVKISLGGVRDESEIRGHRRTYVGAMPGRIIQGMKKAKTSNPIFLLDEVDKLGADWRGDPSAALLEVLDPAQNSTFSDHYLEVDYDLSNVLFIATANSLNMSRPLMDRMEITHLSGYTEEEKVQIAKRHLVPKIMKENGLKATEFSLSDEALKDIIRYYTRESGVRNLEREIANIARKILKKILTSKIKSLHITRRNLGQFAGIKKYRFGEAEKEPLVGVTTGLAWTEVGGDLLSIEASISEGKGKVVTTGKLGKVMEESIHAAMSFLRANCRKFGISPNVFMKKDFHIHVPEGATPKDGPSAGIAMFTSLVSILSGVAVRSDVAMTGEITLKGRVLPIGGLKEKLLAAQRGGIKLVLIPEDNQKDLEEIPASVKRDLKVVPVKRADEVLELALVHSLPAHSSKELDSSVLEVDPIVSPSHSPKERVLTHN